mgnify:CR=1 FL=1
METAARTSGCALNRLERHKVRRWQERLMRKTCCIRVVPITHYPLPITHGLKAVFGILGRLLSVTPSLTKRRIGTIIYCKSVLQWR